MALMLRHATASGAGSPAQQREERKYPLPSVRSALLTAWIDARLSRDAQYPEGVITSCYYDTAQHESYQESLDGEFAKQKLRLRWYGDPVDRYAGVWLELKSRIGARSVKQRLRIPVHGDPDRFGLVIPSSEELTRRLRELSEFAHAPLDPTLQPTVLVRYRRIRWQSSDGSLRASLDTDVRAGNPQAAPIWLPIADGSVLELKSREELPPQIAHLKRLGLRRTAHSKYALALERLYGTQQ